MTDRPRIDESQLVDERDLRYIRAQEDPEQRERIFCAVTTWRQADRLAVGDEIPSLSLAQLEGGDPVALQSARSRGLVLIFGSYT